MTRFPVFCSPEVKDVFVLFSAAKLKSKSEIMQDGQTSNCNQIEIDNSNWLQNYSNLQQVIIIIDRNHYRNKNFAEYCFFWYKSRKRRGLNLQKSAFFCRSKSILEPILLSNMLSGTICKWVFYAWIYDHLCFTAIFAKLKRRGIAKSDLQMDMFP